MGIISTDFSSSLVSFLSPDYVNTCTIYCVLNGTYGAEGAYRRWQGHAETNFLEISLFKIDRKETRFVLKCVI